MKIADLDYIDRLSQTHLGAKMKGAAGYRLLSVGSSSSFTTLINTPLAGSNSAAATGSAEAINNTSLPTFSFTRGDSVALATFLGGSYSASASVAVINLAK